ncbi:hypothetical protein DS742_11705 [Lacrimispora amygdalina]|uniref:DNA topology modulation protein FlaR n=1 Tax=Lacrimispora amygdalina TaxID=253257 RepID=A0A3E2ND07_9FIRM|nr:hypothetical protein [Clostridium indicum]RFZ78770.1 hypothetical protein DS742_11705 [Clostridium indicum]
MKILIFGSVASGKTTLAIKISEELSIIYYEGDCIAWGFPNEKRYKRSDQEQKEIIDKIDENSSWIIEGTYRESQKILYDLADKIIFLDTPLYIRIYRIIFRFIKQKIGYEKSNYKPTYDMLKHMFKWTNDFERNRNFHKNRLIKYEKKLIWIKSPNQLKGKI